MNKMLNVFYGFECELFRKVNRHFDKKLLNLFFRSITHLGGARFTITATLFLLIMSTRESRLIAIASALSLSASHIPVHLAKQLLPRKRPYLIIEKSYYPENPLGDHSFPSGHTTAFFAVMTPYMMLNPHLCLLFIPVGICVGLSRIYLGLHFPSDVIVGAFLGMFFGSLSYLLLFS